MAPAICTWYTWSPSSSGSSAPVMVTVWGVFQLAAVNVRNGGASLPSPGRDEPTGSAPSADGRAVRTTVNVAVPPASVVTRPVVGDIVMPDASLSVLLTDTSAGFRPL